MATLASLSVKLGLDPDQFRGGLAAARTSLKQFRSGIDSSSRDVATLGNALGAIGKPSALLALAGAAISLSSAIAPASGAMLAVPAAAGVAGAALAVLKIGTSGLGDALSALADGDAKKIDEALKKLSPQAQAFARSLDAVRQRYGALKQTVQERLFAGLGQEVEQLGATYLPILDKGLGKTATSMNGLAREASSAANTPFMRGVVADVLNRTAGVMNTLRPAVSGLVISVGALARGGLPLVERFAQWASGAASSAGAFLSSAAGAAWMAEKVDQAEKVLRQLWAITKNLTAGLRSVFAAADPAGDLLATIEKLTARFAAWAATAQGQAQLNEMFTALRELAVALLAILPQFIGALSTVVGWFVALPAPVQSVVASFLAWSLLLGPLIVKFAPLIALLGRLGPLLIGVAGHAVLITARLGLMATAAATAAATTGASALKIVAAWLMMAAASMANAIRMAAAWVVAMGPIGWAIAAVVGLVALIIANWDTVKRWTQTAWAAVSGFVSNAWNSITGFVASGVNRVRGVLNWFGGLGAMFAGWWNSAATATSGAIGNVVGYVAGLPGRITGALGNVGSLLWNSGSRLVSGFWDGIIARWAQMVDWVKRGMANLRSLWPFSPAKTGPFSGRGYVTHSGRALTADFADSIRKGMPGVASAVRGVLAVAQGGFSATVAPGGVTVSAAQPAVPSPRGVTASPGSGGIRLTFDGKDPGSELGRAIMAWLRGSIRIEGGDVQGVLGS